MLGKNYKYNGYDLSDFNVNNTRAALQQVSKNFAVRQTTINLANFHGANSSPTLAWVRTFDFNGVIYWEEYIREKKFQTLNSFLHIEWNPFDPQFHTLSRDTKFGGMRTVQAKVVSPPQPTNDLCNHFIPFTFQLQADDPRIYDPCEKKVNWSVALIWGTPLSTTLWTPLLNFCGAFEVINSWDWSAPFKIQAQWRLVNPKIYIYNQWELKFFLVLDTTTTNLIVDNRDITKLQFDVTDNGVNISNSIRKKGGWWPMYLSSWINTIVLTCDNYTEAKWNTDIQVTFRDTYSY